MIFNRFLTPWYEHKNPQKRIIGLKKIDHSQPESKRIVLELALNDIDDSVCLAAVELIQEFETLLRCYFTAKKSIVKTKALERLMTSISETLQSSPKSIIDRLCDIQDKSFLEHCLFNNTAVQSNDDCVFALLKMLDNPNIDKRYFKQAASITQKITIIEQITELKLLNTFAKLSNETPVVDAIEQHKKHLEEKLQKPIELLKQAKLTNAKLLALKNTLIKGSRQTLVEQYSHLQVELSNLCEQFNSIKPEFFNLDKDIALEQIEKFIALKVSLESQLSELEVHRNDWLNERKRDRKLASFSAVLDEIQSHIQNLVPTEDLDTDTQVKLILGSLNSLAEELKGFEQSESLNDLQQTEKNKILDKHEELITRIQQTPEIQTLLESAHAFLNDHKSVDNIDLSDAQTLLTSVKNHQQVCQPYSFNAEVSRCSEQLQQISKELNDSIKQQLRARKNLKTLESKLRLTNSFIDQGRYKSAISVFTKLQKQGVDEQVLPKRVIKTYTDTSDKIAELKELQSYIAGPRKPALIERVVDLIDDNDVDISARSQQIKALRKEWNTLGKIDSEEDAALNKQFDELIEKAFKPCREYFTEQDKQRAVNFEQICILFEEMNTTLNECSDEEAVKLIERYRQRFQKFKVVDRDKTKEIHKTFKQLISSFTEKASRFFDDNCAQKKALIKQAEALSHIEDVNDAAEQAKALQRKWKSIKYAGKQQDNALWAEFRKFNDAVFKRLSEHKAEQKSQQDSEYAEIKKMLDAQIEALKQVQTLKDVSGIEQELDSLDERVKKGSKHLAKSISSSLSRTLRNLQKKRQEIEQNNVEQGLHQVFHFLRDDKQQEGIRLPSFFASKPSKDASYTEFLKALTSAELVLLILIINKHDELIYSHFSPEQKQSVSMQFMAYRLQGNILSIDDILRVICHEHNHSQELVKLVDVLEQSLISEAR